MADPLPVSQHHAIGTRPSMVDTAYGFAHRLGAWICAGAIAHALLT